MPKQVPTTILEKDRTSLYEADFFEWTQRTAALLRQRRFDELDAEDTATEIEDMGRRDARELSSRLEVLVAHLLKWQFQSDARGRSWRRTVLAQRLAIKKLLEQSPSLAARLRSSLADSYRGAVKRAAVDTGYAHDHFPDVCPYAIDQLLDEDFLPE